jgi:hypothetical protein
MDFYINLHKQFTNVDNINIYPIEPSVYSSLIDLDYPAFDIYKKDESEINNNISQASDNYPHFNIFGDWNKKPNQLSQQSTNISQHSNPSSSFSNTPSNTPSNTSFNIPPLKLSEYDIYNILKSNPHLLNQNDFSYIDIHNILKSHPELLKNKDITYNDIYKNSLSNLKPNNDILSPSINTHQYTSQSYIPNSNSNIYPSYIDNTLFGDWQNIIKNSLI